MDKAKNSLELSFDPFAKNVILSIPVFHPSWLKSSQVHDRINLKKAEDYDFIQIFAIRWQHMEVFMQPSRPEDMPLCFRPVSRKEAAISKRKRPWEALGKAGFKAVARVAVNRNSSARMARSRGTAGK